MPRFFFHVHDDVNAQDEEGLELTDAAAAHRHALKGARDLICEEVRSGRLHLDHAVVVEDEKGESLFRVAFRDAVQISD